MTDSSARGASSLSIIFVRIVGVIALNGVLLPITRAPGATNIDHLVPVDALVESGYRNLLERKLYQTDANYVRVVVLPSSASVGELALSLYAKDGRQQEVFLTSTQAERNLWYAASDLDVGLAIEPPVTIRRVDVPFPRGLAAMVSGTIREMVRQSHQPSSSDRIKIHGTDILFFVPDPTGIRIEARLAPESHGRLTAAIRRLVDLLEAYCTGPPAERPVLRKRLLNETKKLQGSKRAR
jgi:hypothetical protein